MSGTDLFYAIIAGIVPSIVWLFFWNREDRDQPEPRSLLAGCFALGMGAVIIAVFAEQYVTGFVSTISMKYSAWAIIEEVLKLAAVAIVALQSKYYDEPIDAMIYCIAAALGFAALENTLFILSSVSGGTLATGLLTGNMRFVGATLVHVVSSALVGFGLAFTYYRKVYVKIIGLIVSLAAAVALHAWFNISIIGATSGDTLKAFGWIWMAVVLLIVLFEEAKAVKLHEA